MRLRRLALVLALFALAGCTREVASGLDESDANRGVVALARAGVDAEKIPDSATEGRFRLVVSRDEATIAISVLASEELPRVHAPAAPPQGLITSPEADRAARIASIASSIERTLVSVDGVHDARVHLDVPVIDPLAGALAGNDKSPRATASVLLRHRSATPPIQADDIRKIVAGAVSGMVPADVAVVLVAVPKATLAGDRELAHLGPLAVARSSLPTLRGIAIGAFILLALLGSSILVLAMRLRQSKDAQAGAAS